jgi:hypothetical protein
MKLIHTGKHRKQFEVIHSCRSTQAAMMTHFNPARPATSAKITSALEQWLVVISGTGRAA